MLCLAQLEGGHHAIGGCKAGNSTSTLASSSAVATPPSGGTSGGWRGVVCVDFGSMGRMGLLPAGGLRRLLGVLCGALGELGMWVGWGKGRARAHGGFCWGLLLWR